MNIFRLIADSLHLFAVVLLLAKIIRTRSCAAISGKSQILFLIVYWARYLDVFTVFISAYNTVLKLAYILLHCVTVSLIHPPLVKYITIEKGEDSFPMSFMALSITLPLVLGTFVTWDYSIQEVCINQP